MPNMSFDPTSKTEDPEIKVRGRCDECGVDEPIAKYPYSTQGLGQGRNAAKRMADGWKITHQEKTAHTTGHVRVTDHQGAGYGRYDSNGTSEVIADDEKVK